MKIGVISDTHDNLNAIKEVVSILSSGDFDVIFHCGDIVSPFVVNEFKPIGNKMHVTFGNNDGDIYTLTNRLHNIGAKVYNTPSIVTLEDTKIFFMHGFNGVELTNKIVTSLAKSNDYDIILYGHTHFAKVEKIGSTLIVNPGECSGYLTGKRSYAIIDTEKKEAIIEYF
ncbi:MAG: metallophosphoesterase [Candidatus Asgardarchaeia archaeon]